MSQSGDMTDSDYDFVWQALADPVRRAILDLLAVGPMTTGHLAGRFPNLCRTAVMKHVDVLVAAHLVLVRREGRFRWNSLNPVPLERVCLRWLNPHLRRLTSSLNRLKDIVEAGVLPASLGSDGAEPVTKDLPGETRKSQAK